MNFNISICLVDSPQHSSPGHPENPNRFRSIRDELSQHLPGKIQWLEPDLIQPDMLTTVHPESYVRFIEGSAENGPGIVDYGDTYVTRSSFQDALNAVAATLGTLEAILDASASKGFAIIRPPGHHAASQKAMGFCLFNNIAIASRHAQTMGLQRVAIVDFDVHHGNGTQDIFYADPDVLYISTHQSGIFPGTGTENETGYQEGLGTTINIPFPGGVGDDGFDKTFTAIIQPSLYRFRPDILLVSAGYDAHHDDPLAGLQVTGKGYYEITHKLVGYADELCEGRMMMVLEGGYNPEALSSSIRNSCLALAGMNLPETAGTGVRFSEPDIQESLQNIRRIHSL